MVINGSGSTGNTIGWTRRASRNPVAGNGEQGVEISASGANSVGGNPIGTTKTSIADLGNVQDGMRTIGASNNVVRDNVVAFNGNATHNDNGVAFLKRATLLPWATAFSSTPSSPTKLWA